MDCATLEVLPFKTQSTCHGQLIILVMLICIKTSTAYAAKVVNMIVKK